MSRALLVALVSCGLWAQSMPQRVGVGVVQRKVTLQDAVETALRANLEIEIEKTNTQTAREQVRGALGYLDTRIQWSPLVESRDTPTASLLLGENGTLSERLLNQNFYVRQRLPWAGSSLNFDFENARQSTTSPFIGLNPYFTSRMVLSFTVPLLRNRNVDPQRAEVRIRRKETEISDVTYELKVIDVVARVEQAYWDLVAARQDVQVKADGVEWAREQLARNQRMIQGGVLAPVELSAAEAELERRVDTYYEAVGVVTQVENALKTLLSDNRDAAIWNEELLPVDQSVLEPPAAQSVVEAVTTALKQRPEQKVVAKRLESNEVQKELGRDQIRPQANLVAGYATSGLGGRQGDIGRDPFTDSFGGLFQRLNELSVRSGLPAVPPPTFGGAPDALIGGYGTTMSNLFAGRYQTFQGGLQVDFNLRNRTAHANLAQAIIGEKRLKLEQARVEQSIEAEVRNALQSIETARQRRVAAEAGARAAKEKLDSETRLFQNGESTNFLVLTRQNEFTDSRRRVVVASLDFNRAVARLQQALGSTLQSHKITLQ